jgi:hypothetical protein
MGPRIRMNQYIMMMSLVMAMMLHLPVHCYHYITTTHGRAWYHTLMNDA